MRIGIDARKLADYGIGTYIRGLLGALAELERDADLVSRNSYFIFAPASAAALIPPSMDHVPFDAPHYSLRELVTLGRAIDEARLDLFHAPHYVVPATDCPFVVTIHDLIHLRHANPLARMYARTMIGRAVRRSRRILTVSEAVKRDIVETFRCDEAKVVVTPNGVGRVEDSIAPSITASGGYFLFVGNDKPHKNVDTLVAAARQLGAPLVLAGAPFERFHDREGVICPGFVSDDDLQALYRGAIALVMPSLDEGFGLPALEAMAAGTAVITSDAPALIEVTGDAALHAAARSVEALADAMQRVLRDADLRAALASRGLERARSFTWKRCAELTRDVYRSR